MKRPVAIAIAAAALTVLAFAYRSRVDGSPLLSWEEIDELERWPVLEEA